VNIERHAGLHLAYRMPNPSPAFPKKQERRHLDSPIDVRIVGIIQTENVGSKLHFRRTRPTSP